MAVGEDCPFSCACANSRASRRMMVRVSHRTIDRASVRKAKRHPTDGWYALAGSHDRGPSSTDKRKIRPTSSMSYVLGLHVAPTTQLLVLSVDRLVSILIIAWSRYSPHVARFFNGPGVREAAWYSAACLLPGSIDQLSVLILPQLTSFISMTS